MFDDLQFRGLILGLRPQMPETLACLNRITERYRNTGSSDGIANFKIHYFGCTE
jgi:hypothetical protein